MPYPTKPKFVFEGSNMCTLLTELSNETVNINEFDIQYRRDVIYPAKRLGLIKRGKQGDLSTTYEGKKLLRRAV